MEADDRCKMAAIFFFVFGWDVMVCLSCWLTCRIFERLQKLLTYIFWQKSSSFVFCIGLGNLEGWELCCMAIYDTCGLLVSLVVWKVLESVYRKHFHIYLLTIGYPKMDGENNGKPY